MPGSPPPGRTLLLSITRTTRGTLTDSPERPGQTRRLRRPAPVGGRRGESVSLADVEPSWQQPDQGAAAETTGLEAQDLVLSSMGVRVCEGFLLITATYTGDPPKETARVASRAMYPSRGSVRIL